MQTKLKKTLFYLCSIPFILSLVLFLVGCNSSKINVISRDAASGTRSTFDATIGIDSVRKDASFLNANGMILSCINRDRRAIGYVAKKSYDASRKNFKNVKSIQLDGLDAEDSNYNLGHTLFLVYTNEQLNNNLTLKTFMQFIQSKEGFEIVDSEGYTVPNINNAGQPFQKPTVELTEKIIIGGSTTTEPLMQKLKEGFKNSIGKNIENLIEIQGGGSSKGIKDVKEGNFHLGMTSRSLTEEEKQGINVYNLATENIVIVVNTKNPIQNLSTEQVRGIYQGTIRDWTVI